MTDKNDDISIFTLGREARERGKATYFAWRQSQRTGEDPLGIDRRNAAAARQERLAYSEYVRDNDKTITDTIKPTERVKPVSQVDFTLDDVKKVIDFRFEDFKRVMDDRFIAEREVTRQLVREEVTAETSKLQTQFQSFIDDNFQPAINHLDKRLDDLEDCADRTVGSVAELRLDVRHIKQSLRNRGISAAVPAAS